MVGSLEISESNRMFMSSGHWQNTGLARFINDNLYHYNTSDEKSMNPMKWYSINNGGQMDDTRECINGFPCRLILVNDGTTPLLEGQAEPTPGNTKDMGIFNFNNDKSNTNTMGLDNKIFPNCLSFEVASNSDTSAGAFIPFYALMLVNESVSFEDGTFLTSSKQVRTDYIDISTVTNGIVSFETTKDNIMCVCRYFDSDKKYLGSGSNWYNSGNKAIDKIKYSNIKYIILVFQEGQANGGVNISPKDIISISIDNTEITKNSSQELAYLQDSFELRYPDADDYGADYGYLGMNVDTYCFRTMLFGGARVTSNISVSFFNANELILEDTDFIDGVINIYVDGVKTQITQLPYTIDISSAEKIKFEPYGSTNWTYLQLNGVKYFIDDIHDQSDTNLYEPHIKKQFSTDYGLKRVIDWVGNASQEEFVANFEQYFNKQYTLRYYLIVILLAMVDNLG